MKSQQETNDPNDVNHGNQLNPDHLEYHHSREEN